MYTSLSKLSVIPVVLLAVAATAATADKPPGFYEGTNQGWFWKEPAPAIEEEEPIPERELPPLGQSIFIDDEPAEEVIPLHPEFEGPRPFSPAWLREKLPEYRDKALEDPTQENVRAYYYVQRYAVDMAERFALTGQKVVLADPVLDENNRRPLNAYGAQVFDEQAKAATEQIAKKLAGEVGLWYFYRSDCPYCKAQNPILANMQRKLDLAVLPIALDGRPMPDGQFAKFVTNQGHAEDLNVKATPTLFMVKPNGNGANPDFVLLAEGLVTEASLKRRMILGAHEAGWISDAELNLTKPVKPIQIQADLGELPEEVLSDPKQLVEILRSKITSNPYID